jgi:superfamily II DNA or RNA helicase
MDACKNFFESKNKAGLIIAPTGTGKSYLMNYISICYYIFNTTNDVIIMTKRKEILDSHFIKEGNKFIKTLNLNIEFINLININDKDINYNIFSKENQKSRIFIINSDKFISSTKFKSYEDYNFGKIKLLLFDECHWCGANNIYKFINYMKNNIVDKIIGFSATPIRQQEKNKDNSFEIFKNSDNEYNIIYIRNYLDSILDGDRVKTYWIPIKTNFKNLEKEEIDELDNDIIKGRCLNENGFIDFIKKLNKFFEDNKSICGKGILWFPNIKNLIKFYNFIKENKKNYSKFNNTSFFPTYSKNKDYPEDTSSNLENFKQKKENAILLSVFRATEGFDDKSIDFGFNVYTVQTSNPLLDQQKEGRVSRKYEENNKKKSCGYFGFLINQDYNEDDENDNIARRLADWIDYMKQFNVITNNKEKNKSKKTKTTEDYLDIILNSKNFEKSDLDKIKKKIFKYTEKINGEVTPSIIKKIIHKENKKRHENKKELIDTKEKYDIYADEWGLTLSNNIKDVENNNWVKLLRFDFNNFIKQFYTWDELEEYVKEKKICSISNFQKINNNKIPNYSLILSGIYNENKNEKALVNILYKPIFFYNF